MAGKVDVSRFGMVPARDIPRSAFDMTHTHKTTFSASNLVPLYVQEVLPGDSVKMDMTAFARLATPIVPVLDNLTFESFFFFVPCRLLWSNWERFMGEQTSPTDTTSFLVPTVALVEGTHITPMSLADYMGIVSNVAGATITVNALPFRAYNLIWNEWFRDQDLQNPVTVSTGDGPDTPGDYTVLKRGKRHDYFTTARPWPLKPSNRTSLSSLDGALVPGGSMSFGLQTYGVGAPVSGLGVNTGSTGVGISAKTSGARNETFANAFRTDATVWYAREDAGVPGYPDVRVLVNDIRTSMMVQQMLERNARGGTRYAELLWSHFRVTPQDARLQRPEYLGGGRSMISMNPVAQTSATGVAGTTTVLGEQAAVGSFVARHGFSQSFLEHGYIIGLGNVRADLTYQQGNHRMWYRRTLFDFFWPDLAHLGEQAILRKEIYAIGAAGDDTVFGYQERWSEYKYHPSRISGYFRSIAASALDMWHFAEEFGSAPVLNSTFIVDPTHATVTRSLQVDVSGAQFLCDTLFRARMVRAMPMYSIPGLGARL